MARGYNKVQFIGNVGRDPELKVSENNTTYAKFSIAVSDKRGTFWVECVVFGKQAEIAHEYIRKGNQLFVEGRLNYDIEQSGPRAWLTKQGDARASFDVTVYYFHLLGGRDEREVHEEAEEYDFPF